MLLLLTTELLVAYSAGLNAGLRTKKSQVIKISVNNNQNSIAQSYIVIRHSDENFHFKECEANQFITESLVQVWLEPKYYHYHIKYVTPRSYPIVMEATYILQRFLGVIYS